METLDLSSVQPVARPMVEAVSTVYLRHVRPWLIGLMIHGSALKGGFIPACSDIDLHVYLDDAAFTAQGQLPLEVCLAIQQELAQIDPAPFQYIQCYALPPRLPAHHIGPVPGAYQMLIGSLPVSEATEEQLREAARTALKELQSPPEYITRDLLQSGGGKLERLVRLVCTDVWPALYQMLSIARGRRRPGLGSAERAGDCAGCARNGPGPGDSGILRAGVCLLYDSDIGFRCLAGHFICCGVSERGKKLVGRKSEEREKFALDRGRASYYAVGQKPTFSPDVVVYP